ncbi:hypothetical protein BGW37DRAFT_555042 [Umbelopsis sp. PMI_123]|nr:hypothetical protein BGW37DRAFT_555042 [Umbelopsis sp. PMI_123]
MPPAIIETSTSADDSISPPSYNAVEPPPIPPPNDLPLAYHYDYYRQCSVPKPEDAHHTRPPYPPPRYTPRQTGEFVCYVNPDDSLDADIESNRKQQRFAARAYICCLAMVAVVGLVSIGIIKASA